MHVESVFEISGIMVAVLKGEKTNQSQFKEQFTLVYTIVTHNSLICFGI